MTKPQTPTAWARAHNERRREHQRIHPKWKDDWPPFIKEAEKRLKRGHREYGDGSFDRPLFTLLAEVEEEILDQVNWSFIAWTRIKSLRERVQKLEDRLGDEEFKALVRETVEDSKEILESLE